MIKTILLIVHTIVCLSLIMIVILQSGRSAGISGEIAGGAETFFGKNKARTLNGMLGRWTTYAAVVFVITSLALTVSMEDQNKGANPSIDNEQTSISEGVGSEAPITEAPVNAQ